MEPDLPDGQAEQVAPAKKPRKPRGKDPRFPPRKAAPKKRRKKKAQPKRKAVRKAPIPKIPRGYKLVKVPKKRPDAVPNFGDSAPFKPHRLKIANDILDRQSLRFRTLFPNKWNEIECAMTPMDVMLTAMQLHMAKGGIPGYVAAAKIAKDIMPYMHPRLSHIHATTSKGVLEELTEEQIAWMMAAADKNLKERHVTIDGRASEDKGEASSRTDPETAGEITLLTISG